MPTRICVISYRDRQGVEHSVEVSAETRYEAVALGLAALQKSTKEFSDDIGSLIYLDRVTVTLRDVETHDVDLKRFRGWLNRNGGCAPREMALKARLRELLGFRGEQLEEGDGH